MPGALAQKPERIWRIGFLDPRARPGPDSPDPYLQAFVDGMRELAYVEGENLAIEWRFAGNKFELLPGLAQDLVRRRPEVLVAYGNQATEALQQATRALPIVSTAMGSYLASNLAKPDGNVTGLTPVGIDLVSKQMELLKSLLPQLSSVAVLLNPGNPQHRLTLKALETAARRAGARILSAAAGTPEDIERAFEAMVRDRADATIILPDALFVAQQPQIAALATKHRLPSMFHYREFAKAGGLLSYGPDLAYMFRRSASYVDRILKGAKPGDLPIEQPTRLQLAINLKAARSVGLVIPQELLLRADEVIE